MGITIFLAHTAAWTPQWFNKPKFHYLLHLEDHIRRFGPAVVFATEAFESFNSVIRTKSVHSNRLAPSRDIALSFAHMNRVRSLLCGGKVRTRQLTEDGQPSGDINWIPVGRNLELLLGQSDVLTGYLGSKVEVVRSLCKRITPNKFEVLF